MNGRTDPINGSDEAIISGKKGAKPRLLILRPDNIGDVLLFSGALRHLRQHYCDFHITVAVQGHIKNLLELCPFVDDVVSLDELQWWKRSGASHSYLYRRACKVLQRVYNAFLPKYDKVIVPLKSPQASHMEMVLSLGARDTVGMAGCSLNYSGFTPRLSPARVFTRYLDMTETDPWQHELVTNCEFIRYLGCRVTNLQDLLPEVWIDDSDKEFAAQVMGNLPGPVIGVFPGASDAIRTWDSCNYRALSEGIVAGSYVIFGGPNEAALAKDVADELMKGRSNQTVVVLAGETTLRQLYACMSWCSVLVSVDTGGLHLGIAAGIPTVGIVGGGHYGRFVPWGDTSRNIFHTERLDCFHCNWLCPFEKARCISNVAPEKVVSAVTELLQHDEELRSVASAYSEPYHQVLT